MSGDITYCADAFCRTEACVRHRSHVLPRLRAGQRHFSWAYLRTDGCGYTGPDAAEQRTMLGMEPTACEERASDAESSLHEGRE